jgi:N-acetyl sugar amidotransferase
MTENYQRCTYCIMDTSDPDIIFDDQGVCNHCKRQIKLQQTRGYRKGVSEIELESIVQIIKDKQRNAEYDVVVGVSGGVDSAFVLHKAAELKLRVLAVHVDAGWNSETAVSNIKKLCQSLDIDLHTYVIDWNQMKELQRAFVLSGISNLDIPQDHVFLAGVYRLAREYKVKFVLNGSNFATEGIFPATWEHNPMDNQFIKQINKLYSRTKKINNLPIMSLYQYIFMNISLKKINLLNYFPYSKTETIKLLTTEYGWDYYGGKHFESRFTRFFQSYYTVKKYGYDKRIAHLSSLIVNGELSRQDALEIFKQIPYDENLMKEDLMYILKKLDLTMDDWEYVLSKDRVVSTSIKNSSKLLDKLLLFRNRLIRK